MSELRLVAGTDVHGKSSKSYASRNRAIQRHLEDIFGVGKVEIADPDRRMAEHCRQGHVAVLIDAPSQDCNAVRGYTKRQVLESLLDAGISINVYGDDGDERGSYYAISVYFVPLRDADPRKKSGGSR